MELKVMTYNIASGRYYANDRDVTPEGSAPVDLSKCAEVIRREQPDICGINEINDYLPGYLASKNISGTPNDQTAFLTESTGLENGCFGRAIHFSGRGDYGNSVLSRYAVLEAGVIPIPDPDVFDEDRYYETRGITKVKLDIAGGVTVMQVHVGLAVAESQNAVVTLCKEIDHTEGPLILMGDFNMRPGNFLLDRIRQRLTEVLPEGEGYVHTFPSWSHDAQLAPELKHHPYCKLDYIFVSNHFRAEACRVLPVRVSDHMPMVASLCLKEETQT